MAALSREAVAAPHSLAAAKGAVGVLVDLTKCNGCRRCEAACCQANGFPVPSDESLKDNSVYSTRRHLDPQHLTIVNEHQASGNGFERAVYVKANCMHCVDPACVSACLVGALRKQPEGAVTYDAQKCMGCRYCMVACPFEVPAYEYDNAFTPQVRKCTFCFEKDDSGALRVPACVSACPKECLTFGPRDALLVRAREKIREHPGVYVDHIYGEHEAGGTSWLYLAPMPFEKIGYPVVAADALPRLSESIQHGVFAYFVPPAAWCAVLALTTWLTRPPRPQSSRNSGADQKVTDPCESQIPQRRLRVRC